MFVCLSVSVSLSLVLLVFGRLLVFEVNCKAAVNMTASMGGCVLSFII